MRSRGRSIGAHLRRSAIPAAIFLLSISAAAQTLPDIDTLLARVSERLERYYRRAQLIVCMEKASVMPIGSDLGPAGFMRVIESELRVEPESTEDGDTLTNAKLVRQILKINGRAPSEKNKNDRSRCTDPNPLTPEPLAFLLPANREGYTFTSGGFGKGKDGGTLVLEFATRRERGEGKLVEDSRGVEDCFGFSVTSAWKGRIWVDAETYDVVRMEQRLSGPGDIEVTWAQQRKHQLPASIVVQRYDTTIKFKSIAFTNPEETMLVPESIETMTVLNGGLQSTRRRQEYSEYKRFLTTGRIVK
jgi:hypothetical protein